MAERFYIEHFLYCCLFRMLGLGQKIILGSNQILLGGMNLHLKSKFAIGKAELVIYCKYLSVRVVSRIGKQLKT